jgi:hypothetical protein
MELRTMGHSIYYRLLHNVLNFPEETASKNRNSGLVIYAALRSKFVILLHCRVSQGIVQ